jgi:hypothetical protein
MGGTHVHIMIGTAEPIAIRTRVYTNNLAMVWDTCAVSN